MNLLRNFFNYNKESEWIKQKEDLIKYINNDDNNQECKRYPSKCQRIKVWENSNIHKHFDPDFFREDILGYAVVKNLSSLKTENEDRYKLSYDIEHFISYSHGGKTETENLCILGRGINRSKKDREIFTLNFDEKTIICEEKCISFEELLSELRSNLHETCKKYNILFGMKKGNKRWTIRKYYYNDEYKKVIEIYSDQNQDKNYPIFEIDNNEEEITKQKEEYSELVLEIAVISVLISIVTIEYIGCKIYNHFCKK
ncbi:MAG TPA: hypothetical protein V6C58_08020 [Allocoleopsis sp.]